mmetsp:Transcript_22269/g.19116  ORF Transcript_22269/g.19116 Transcript_22269/m.19116 type:complete len:82 (+) Transcript_22269:1676-1921(+)
MEDLSPEIIKSHIKRLERDMEIEINTIRENYLKRIDAFKKLLGDNETVDESYISTTNTSPNVQMKKNNYLQNQKDTPNHNK